MIAQLVFAFALAGATVVIHALGTLEVITHLVRKWQKIKDAQGFLALEIQMVRIVSVLLALHLLEAGAWGAFYWSADLLPDLETALYFSLTSYTTVGYGDVVLPDSWRLLGPFEAAVGILMFGWSTGILVTSLTRIYEGRLHLAADHSTGGNQRDGE